MRWRPPAPGQKVGPFPSTKPAAVDDEAASKGSSPGEPSLDAAAPGAASANDPHPADRHDHDGQPEEASRNAHGRTDVDASANPGAAPATRWAEAVRGDEGSRQPSTDQPGKGER
ncbi:hypothetical protein C5B96_09835 [Subtercola sp. Z020]|uniref:hypothetical protein n=1 Tax=Subtercola sp. Z020 TaxID=2080582 RepID=UPI000CE8C980|nr:hypothetical protein [Subtercola sp. Z020]PPF82244.1 hypothetical protein C5B96_09835 [Subtercola sp. Z020]